MPPKKGKEKGKKKSDVPVERLKSPEPTEKELLLSKELDDLTLELNGMKDNVTELRSENDWLQTEAHKVRVESHEYMSYMEKKTSKRQTTIISLNDHNQKQIQDIRDEKKEMLDHFEEKKAELRAILMDKENQLSKNRKELEELQEYKNLQQEQLTKIKELEKEVMVMRGKHSDAIQQLKSNFLNEKREFQEESEHKISSMSKQANKEAFQCLSVHTNDIKSENRNLRQELLMLIRKTRALNEHKTQLDDQKTELLMEQQYATDLKTLRSARQHKVYKGFGLLEKGEEKD